jgi:Flp pilus assembly protein TadD
MKRHLKGKFWVLLCTTAISGCREDIYRHDPYMDDIYGYDPYAQERMRPSENAPRPYERPIHNDGIPRRNNPENSLNPHKIYNDKSSHFLDPHSSSSPHMNDFQKNYSGLKEDTSLSLLKMLEENEGKADRGPIVESIKKILAQKYENATEFINLALFEDPKNPSLHFLNGLNYHLSGKKGNISHIELAEAGYLQALKYNNNNPLASLQLGRLYIEQEKYEKAQEELANTLLIDPSVIEAFYELASASYMIGDLHTALMAIDQYLKRLPQKNAESYRAAALIYAASGKQDIANQYLQEYKKLEKGRTPVKILEQRIQDWKAVLSNGHMLVAQDDGEEGGTGGEEGGGDDQGADTGASAQAEDEDFSDQKSPSQKPQKQPEGPPKSPEDEMVIIDGVLTSVLETNTTDKGTNILDTFSVNIAPGTHMRTRRPGDTQGGSSSVFPYFEKTGLGTIRVTDGMGSASDTLGLTRIFTQGLSFGSITYSARIANATRDYVETIGRPSLVASVGKPAKFFSGVELKLPQGGQFGGNITDTPVGVTVEVNLISIKNDFVVLDITLKGSLISGAIPEADANNPGGAQSNYLQVNKSSITTRVKVKLGQTIMIGGLSERTDVSGKSGFPILKDLPIIQYFFSNENTSGRRRSVIYMVTPRPYRKTVDDVKRYFRQGERPITVKELEFRHKDWYNPMNNTLITLKGLAPIYREYRTGDIQPLQWAMADNFETQMKEFVSILWY